MEPLICLLLGLAILPLILGLAWALVTAPKKNRRPVTLSEILGLILVLFLMLGLICPVLAGVYLVFRALAHFGGEPEPLAVFMRARWAAGLLAGLGLVEGLGLVRSIVALWTERTQVRNIPTSKVRSVAVGMAELCGVARPAPAPIARSELDGKVPTAEQRALLPPDTMIYSGPLGPKTDGSSVSCDFRSRFYLEDDTGRILVDPREVAFWNGPNHTYALGQPLRVIHLDEKRLKPGDPVYVLGRVEPNREVRPDAVDADRLVVSGHVPGHGARSWRGICEGLLSLGPKRIFFLSNRSEAEGLSQLELALVDNSVLAFCFVSSALVLWAGILR